MEIVIIIQENLNKNNFIKNNMYTKISVTKHMLMTKFYDLTTDCLSMYNSIFSIVGVARMF